MSLVPGTRIGRFTVRRKLAEGGMAEIFLCSALGPEGFAKDAVIKRVRPFLADDPAFVDMFVAEARLASRLEHPNIVQIFDFDRHEDTYYLAMEYVRGASLWQLRRRCREEGRAFPPVLAARIGVEVARALAYAHRLTVKGEPLNVVHRDVTPHNVLVSYEGAVKLSDFGIAHAGKASTAPGMLKGKFAYMSPEQSRGEPVDGRCDVFALGVVLWELLTGGRPFEAESDFAVLRAVQQRVIAPPGRLNPAVPPELDEVVMRALERDLTLRWQSAAELERALQQVVLTHQRHVEDTDVGAYLRASIEPMESVIELAPAPPPTAPAAPAREAPRASVTSAPSFEPTPILPRTPTGAPDLGAAPETPLRRATGAGFVGVHAASISLPAAWNEGSPAGKEPAEPVYTAAPASTAAPAFAAVPAYTAASGEEALTPSPNPDEDGHAPTWLVARDGGALRMEGDARPQGKRPRVEGGRPRPRVRGLTLGLAVAAALSAIAVIVPVASPSHTRPATVPTPEVTPRAEPDAAPGPLARGGVDGKGTQVAPTPVSGAPLAASPAEVSPSGAEVAITPALARGVPAAAAVGPGSASPVTMTAPSLAAASKGVVPEDPEVQPAADEAVVRASARRERSLGLVQLDVFPTAQLRVNGRSRGEVSGKRALQLTEGRHTVLLVHPHRSETFVVDVKRGSTQQVRFNAFGSTR